MDTAATTNHSASMLSPRFNAMAARAKVAERDDAGPAEERDRPW